VTNGRRGHRGRGIAGYNGKSAVDRPCLISWIPFFQHRGRACKARLAFEFSRRLPVATVHQEQGSKWIMAVFALSFWPCVDAHTGEDRAGALYPRRHTAERGAAATDRPWWRNGWPGLTPGRDVALGCFSVRGAADAAEEDAGWKPTGANLSPSMR